MNLIQAAVLGVVQGLTEYIPVSSSAHLVLVPWLAGWEFDSSASFIFEVLVQMGTLVGVLAFFWRDLLGLVTSFFRCLFRGRPFAEPEARLAWLIVLGTLPAIAIGLGFKDYFEGTYSDILGTIIQLAVTGLLLFAAEFFVSRFVKKQKDLTAIGAKSAVIIGLWQALAILPGISRSGATIAGAMFLGFDRVAAARFSFLLSIPAMVGAGVLTANDLFAQPEILEQLAAPLAVGFVAAAVSGYIVIWWLLRFLSSRSLAWFGWYCLAASAACLAIYFAR